MINLVAIGFSILWVWFGTRFNYLKYGKFFENTYVPKELLKNSDRLISGKKTENKAKIITSLVLIILGIASYFYKDHSLVLVYILSIGWLLFYLVGLETSFIYKTLEKRDENNKETQQYIMDKFRKLDK